MLLLAMFLAASACMVGCLNHMERKGLEGTVLGTLIMPYCSGAPNLIFAFVMMLNRGPGREVLINGLVNNLTNLSLLIGLPALLWRLDVLPAGKIPKKALKERRISRLSIALTLLAVLFFCGITWALGRDGSLSRTDGITLVSAFLFWQCFEVCNVLRTNIEKQRRLSAWLLVDIAGLALGAAVMFVSIDRLVAWVSTMDRGLLSFRYIGWLSGWLMVLPNAIPAFYYAAKGRADIVYSSQVGDGHICIPLCIGLFAIVSPIELPPTFRSAMLLLVGMTLTHLGFVSLRGRLPRAAGAALAAGYGVFVYIGLVA